MVRPSIDIYLDGADLPTMRALIEKCQGVTTNPSLMKKSGVTDYRKFAREVLAIADGKPVSFEVLADSLDGIYEQGIELAGLGENVRVKVPITKTDGTYTGEVIESLVNEGVKVNVTAVMTIEQALYAARWIGEADDSPWSGNIISVFAGRIADAGVDPFKTVKVVAAVARLSGIKTLWASARQVYNVIEAKNAGADIITLSPELMAKLDGFGRDLEEYSLATVRQFAKDAEGITL